MPMYVPGPMVMSPLAAPEPAETASPTPSVGGVRATWLITVVAAALSLAIGYRLGLQTHADDQGSTPEDRGQSAQPIAVESASTHSTRIDDTSSSTGLRSIPADPAGALINGEISFEQMAALARADASALAQLWARYRAELDPLRRQTLLALLAEAPSASLSQFVATLVADADPERRRDGYQLLTSLPIEDPALREHALRALQHETDPSALAELVQGLQPGLLAREDAEPLSQALQSLSQSGDPLVRAAALPALTQWTDRAQLEALYLAALADSDAGVRAAAIAGIDTANVSTPDLRGALFQLAANAAENAGHRHSALLALSRFRLSRAEIELYRMLQAEVPVHPDKG